MRVLVTGANGFIGTHLVRALLDCNHEVLAGCKDLEVPADWKGTLKVVRLDLSDTASIRDALGTEVDAIVHLASISYSQDARRNPDEAWIVNVGGTRNVLDAARTVEKRGGAGPLVLVTSTADVYADGGSRPRVETDPVRPGSVYGATKLGAEAAAAHAVAAWGLSVIVVRPFPATGPGQTNRLVPNWLKQLKEGKRDIEGDPTIVRDFTDVRDTAAAYVALLTRGRPGETYNIASGRGVRFGRVFDRLTAVSGMKARLVPPTNPRLEPPCLVGNPRKLHQHTGWKPAIPLDRTLADLVDAQAH